MELFATIALVNSAGLAVRPAITKVLCSLVVFFVKVTPSPAHFSAAERTACMAGKSFAKNSY